MNIGTYNIHMYFVHNKTCYQFNFDSELSEFWFSKVYKKEFL